jgi:hypothetical protein
MSKENTPGLPNITKSKKDLIVQAAVLNPKKRIIANHAGVSTQTLYNWEKYYNEVVIKKIDEGEKLCSKEKMLHEMYSEIDKARVEMLDRIRHCYDFSIKRGDWKAAESFLKIFYREFFDEHEEYEESNPANMMAIPVMEGGDFMTFVMQQQNNLRKSVFKEKDGEDGGE